jgi:hypothetical protein
VPEELKATSALPQDAHLMPKGDELKFQGGTTSNTEGEQGSEDGKNRDHATTVWRRRKISILFHRFGVLSRHNDCAPNQIARPDRASAKCMK